jgi:hypothetical protein
MISTLLAIGLPQGHVKGFDMPVWADFILIPMALILFLYALRRKNKK